MLLVMAPCLWHACAHTPLLGVDDSDVWLRLTLVRQWLQGGSWYDHHYASNAPFSAPISPWTRPLDLVMAVLVKLQPGIELNRALLNAARALPVLWTALSSLALLRALRHLTPAPSAMLMLAVLLVTMGATPAMRTYLGPANADHHGMQMALFAGVLYALIAWRDGWRSPCLLGGMLALMLWISPEALALIAAVFSWFGVRWLCGASLRPLARTASITALGSLLALVAERPPHAWFTLLHDSLSCMHVAALALTALLSWALVHGRAGTCRHRAAQALAAMLIAALLMLALDPLFFAGPMADAAPFITQQFLPHIIEAQPFFAQSLWAVAAGMLLPLAACLTLLYQARHNDGIIPARHAAMLGWLLLACLALYLTQVRWFYYLYPLLALVLAPWLGALVTPHHPALRNHWPACRWQHLAAMDMLLRRATMCLLLFALPLLLPLADMLHRNPDQLACRRDTRRLIQHGELARVAQGASLTLLAPTDAGGELLFFTPHRIVAGNYHREGKAIQQVWNAFTTTDPTAVTTFLARRHVQAWLICPDNLAPANAIANQLRHGQLMLPGVTRVPLHSTHSPHAPALFLIHRSIK